MTLAIIFGISLTSLILWVVFSQILDNEFHWVLWPLLTNLRHCLQKNGYNSLIKVLSNWYVLKTIRVVINWGLGVL